MKTYYVYMLTNNNHNVLYIGVTNSLERRIEEHRQGIADGFTKKYNVRKLIYIESTESIDAAIAREKQLKGWRREKKDALVNSNNPEWKDLSLEW
ncbi:GIY-YIG nuclease family protein [Micavibrio aeruginosavorus]|nr:GIY-YIG nuclease family protein [Micavibrio aeruginosavorus]